MLPIAKMPPGVKFKPGDENIYAGKGTFYTLRYGPYLIGMNCTTDRTFELHVPGGHDTARRSWLSRQGGRGEAVAEGRPAVDGRPLAGSEVMRRAQHCSPLPSVVCLIACSRIGTRGGVAVVGRR